MARQLSRDLLLGFAVPAFLLLGLKLASAAERENESYWGRIRPAIVGDLDRDGAAAVQSYVKELTAEQLIVAGRQCGEEIETEGPEKYESAVYMFAFFVMYYPMHTGNGGIEPILSEIADNGRPVSWRAFLVECLRNDEWRNLLTTDQRFLVIEQMCRILEGLVGERRLQYEACETARSVLAFLERRNYMGEGTVAARMKNGANLRELADEIKGGRTAVSADFHRAQKRLFASYDRYARALVRIVLESDLASISSGFEVRILRSLRDCLGQPIEFLLGARGALEHCIRNYQDFDDDNWHYLAKVAYEDLGMPDAAIITGQMLNEVERRFGGEADQRKVRRAYTDKIDGLKKLLNAKEEVGNERTE